MDNLVTYWELINTHLYLQITAGVIAALFVVFILFFCVRSVVLGHRLRTAARKLSRLPHNCSPDQIRSVFSKYKRLSHLWDEYSETLHNQTETGRDSETTWRATVPAEAYFNNENVVDAYVGADFFKHFPGLFTGIGIIGTFIGLINGLMAFDPTADLEKTISAVTPLIQSVREAFMVSATAIIVAMVVTLLEKLSIARLHARAEKVVQKLDARFDAGVGEEYLARLTKSAEESASQAKILKDQMVEELGEILRAVSHEQSQAMQASQHELAGTLANTIESNLSGPLQRMEDTFKSATGGTEERTVNMLSDVMSSFSDRLNELFGNQISDINELNRQSAEAMQNAASSLNGLIEDMGRTGQETTEQMADKMLEAIKAMESRQSEINNRTESTLNELAGTMKQLMTSMEESHSQRLEASQARETQMLERTSGMVDGLGENVDAAMARMTEASQTMASSVNSLSATTADAIGKLDAGADKVVQATDGMTHAGGEMKQAMAQAATLAEQMGNHSNQLQSGARAIQEVVADYQTQRRAMQELMEQASAIVESARREASITEDVLTRIEQSANNLAQVQGEFDNYLEGVNRVLEESSNSFRDAVTTTLKGTNQQFHDDLSNAVNLLKESIEELEMKIADATAEA